MNQPTPTTADAVAAVAALARAATKRWTDECDEHCMRVLTRPTITVLCGSTRFSDAYREANLRLTIRGHIVLTIGCDTKSDDDLDLAAEAGDGRTADQIKADLDQLHLRKIDLADEVLVLNVGGHIGASTRREIEYAAAHGKTINYLEQA